MTGSRPPSRSMLTAMLCAAAVTAQFVGGKATLVSAGAMLPCLAAFHIASAVLVRRLATQSDDIRTKGRAGVLARARAAAPTPTGLRVVAGGSYLRRLALLVLLGTAGAALL